MNNDTTRQRPVINGKSVKPKMGPYPALIADSWGLDRWTSCQYDATSGKWVAFDGVRWSFSAGEVLAERSVKQYLDGDTDGVTVVKPYREGKPETIDQDFIFEPSNYGKIMRVARSHPRMLVRSPDDWDALPLAWNTPTGTVDLDTGIPRRHEPMDRLTWVSGGDYIPGATAPTFDKFLREALPDADVGAFLQRFFGMALLGEVRDHKFAVFIGNGRNGKGLLVEVMQALFGDYSTGIVHDMVRETKNEGHRHVYMALRGRRLAVVEELPKSSRWDVNKVKSLTGGDRITANAMRQDGITFKPSHTLVVTTNHRPTVDQGERAFWTRYLEVPFTENFEGREDTTLGARIIASELPGVLNWVLAGLADYLRDGLMPPAAVKAATASARGQTDDKYRFYAEQLTVEEDASLSATEMRDRWEWWCEREDIPPGKINGFVQDMGASTGLKQNSRRRWQNVRFATESEIAARTLSVSSDRVPDRVVADANNTGNTESGPAADDTVRNTVSARSGTRSESDGDAGQDTYDTVNTVRSETNSSVEKLTTDSSVATSSPVTANGSVLTVSPAATTDSEWVSAFAVYRDRLAADGWELADYFADSYDSLTVLVEDLTWFLLTPGDGNPPELPSRLSHYLTGPARKAADMLNTGWDGAEIDGEYVPFPYRLEPTTDRFASYVLDHPRILVHYAAQLAQAGDDEIPGGVDDVTPEMLLRGTSWSVVPFADVESLFNRLLIDAGSVYLGAPWVYLGAPGSRYLINRNDKD